MSHDLYMIDHINKVKVILSLIPPFALCLYTYTDIFQKFFFFFFENSMYNLNYLYYKYVKLELINLNLPISVYYEKSYEWY